MLLLLIITEKSIDKCIIGVLELLIHYRHDSDVIIIYQIHFSEVEARWQSTVFICKEEVGHGLSDEVVDSFWFCGLLARPRLAGAFIVSLLFIWFLTHSFFGADSKPVVKKNRLDITVQY